MLLANELTGGGGYEYFYDVTVFDSLSETTDHHHHHLIPEQPKQQVNREH